MAGEGNFPERHAQLMAALGLDQPFTGNSTFIISMVSCGDLGLSEEPSSRCGKSLFPL